MKERCNHEDFEATIAVNRIDDHEVWSADIRLRCLACGSVARFLGMEPGVGGGAPRVSIYADEAHLPVVVDLPPAVWSLADGDELSRADQEILARAMERVLSPGPGFTVTKSVDSAKVEALRIVVSILAAKADVDDEQLIAMLEKAEREVRAATGEPPN